MEGDPRQNAGPNVFAKKLGHIILPQTGFNMIRITVNNYSRYVVAIACTDSITL